MSQVFNWTWNWSTTVTPQASWHESAVLNLAFSSPGLVATSLMLIICFTSPHAKGRTKYPVIGTTFCNFLAAFFTSAMSVAYLICTGFDVKMNFVLCSVLRRAMMNGQSLPYLCYVIIAVDRLFCVCINRPLELAHVFALYVLAFALAATPFFVQMFYGNIFYEDICTYSLQGPVGTTNTVMTFWVVSAATALAINIAILVFIIIHQRNLKRSSRQMSKAEVRNEKMMMYGFTLQSFFPVCTLVPNVTAFYMFVNGAMIPPWFWSTVNCLTYLNHFVNPLLTAIFIKQFRTATLLFFHLRTIDFYQRRTNVTTVTGNRSRSPRSSNGTRIVAWSN